MSLHGYNEYMERSHYDNAITVGRCVGIAESTNTLPEYSTSVSEATDCRTRETEPWLIVSRIRSAEHLHRSRTTELARQESCINHRREYRKTDKSRNLAATEI
jgi:hypothetical protein